MHPNTAPIRPSKPLSMRKIFLICELLAPTAISIPISFVFSRTSIFIMLAMPKVAITMISS
ncbi:MAG: hypothetical protein LUQ47_01430, partial [Methanotrichaceae archaeon]|nr:hypothetical protein [Methanotrichaceae archaeon]